MAKIKYTDEYIGEYLNKFGYELIKHKSKRIIFKDSLGYYYDMLLQNLTHKGNNPPKFQKSNPYTIQNIKLWCELNNKQFELISDIYNGNDKKLKWLCLKEDCQETFEACWDSINTGTGCRICSGHQVGLTNCLATKNPQIASEWHLTKNGDLTPYDVTEHSGKEVWWLCPINHKHEWQARISTRNKHNCPYCSGYYATEENNLLISNPELCEEWNYNKNEKRPEEYTPKSGQFVYWICKECNHNWEASIAHRNNGRGCPECNNSKGEKEIDNILMNNKWTKINQDEFNNLNNSSDIYNIYYYITQKTFDGLVGLGNGLLSYDFYLPRYNILIEYQGEFHDGTAYQQSKEDYIKQLEHDRRKREFAQNNNIKLLEIWYWDFDNIEKILSRELLNIKIKK